jgi:hypothetical protein
MDYIHLANVIQAEVIRVNERKPIEERPALLLELSQFLHDQATTITIAHMKATQELSEAEGFIQVDEIIGTNAYIDGELQPKREGTTYHI